MTRLQLALVILIAAQLAGGAALMAIRLARPAAPVARTEFFDKVTAKEMKALAQKSGTGSPSDWSELAGVYEAYGFWPEAAACYGRAAELAPGDAEIRYLHAFCLSRLGRTEESSGEYRRAIELGLKEKRDAWFLIGQNYEREENSDKAREAFSQAGDLPAARYELARLAFHDGDYRQAIEVVSPIQKSHPDAYAPHFLRSRAELALGHSEQAAKHARAAEMARERLPSPFLDHRDRILTVQGEFGLAGRRQDAVQKAEAGYSRLAKPLLRQALAVEWSPTVADQLAAAEEAEGNFGEALDGIQEIIERDGPTMHRLWRLGDLLHSLQRNEEAAAAWRAAAAMGPESEIADLYRNLALYHDFLGEDAVAQDYEARMHHARGVELFREDDDLTAASEFEAAIEANPRRAQTWFYLAETRRELGDRPAARAAYAECLRLDPNHGRATVAAGELTQ